MTNQPASIGSYVDWYGKSPSDVEVAVHVSINDVQPIVDTEGAPLEPLDALMAYLIRLDKRLVASGFKRSDRLDKPSYGGGGGRPGVARPETPPPADLVVPEHCGATMVYKPPKESADGKKAVAARWECRKGRDCLEPEERNGNKYPATNWRMTKKPEGAPVPEASTSSAKPGPGISDFWAWTRTLHFSPGQVTQIAGAAPVSLSPEQLASLRVKLQKIADERVPA